MILRKERKSYYLDKVIPISPNFKQYDEHNFIHNAMLTPRVNRMFYEEENKIIEDSTFGNNKNFLNKRKFLKENNIHKIDLYQNNVIKDLNNRRFKLFSDNIREIRYLENNNAADEIFLKKYLKKKKMD
jgi:hypothetical protein